MRWVDRKDAALAAGWTAHFAWHPVWLEDVKLWCWLEVIQRKAHHIMGWGSTGDLGWNYRAVAPALPEQEGGR